MSFTALIATKSPRWRARIEGALTHAGAEVLSATDLVGARAALSSRLIHVALVDSAFVESFAPDASAWLSLVARLSATVPFVLVPATPRGRGASSPVAPKPFAAAIPAGGLRRFLDALGRVLGARFGDRIPSHRLAILHSGGDAPGMNAATLAVVSAAEELGAEVLAVRGGYHGLVGGRIEILSHSWLFQHARKPGSCLGTARFAAFRDRDVRQQAARVLIEHRVEGLIVIGGDGSMRGALRLAEEVKLLGSDLRIVVVPGTMDNDLVGCDRSLGASSAVEALIRAHDELVAPADSLGRIFVTEAMGRNAGFVALRVAASVPAEGVLLPEHIVKLDPSRVAAHWRDTVDCRATARAAWVELSRALERAKAAFQRGQRHAFIVVGEGVRLLTRGKIDVERIARHVEREVKSWPLEFRPDVRTHVVGHRARGVLAEDDYLLGLNLGRAAARAILAGRDGVMVGWSERSGVVVVPCVDVLAASDLPPEESWSRRPLWEAERRQYESLISVPDGGPVSRAA